MVSKVEDKAVKGPRQLPSPFPGGLVITAGTPGPANTNAAGLVADGNGGWVQPGANNDQGVADNG